jgi:hypothetical protein
LDWLANANGFAKLELVSGSSLANFAKDAKKTPFGDDIQ